MSSLKRIAGYHKEKAELEGLRSIFLNMETFKESGVRLPRGVLLYGVPGVGKTVMARAIAGDDIPLISLRAADCTRDDSEEYVLAAFKEANQKAPSILLIDELDKIAQSSDRFFMEGNDRIMKVLLQELDGQKDNSGVMVVATCNNCDYINPALLRAGRFDRIIEIGLPSLEDRVEIIQYYLSKITLETKIDVHYFGEITAGYTGAQLECVINEAGIMAMQDGLKSIDFKIVLKAMNRIAFRALEGRIKDKNEQRKTAVHEAGHAVASLFLRPESILTATIIPQGNTRGHMSFLEDEEASASVEDIENNVVIAMAGSAAEEIVLGRRYRSSTYDFAKARGILSDIVWGIGAYGIEFAGLNARRVRDAGPSIALIEKGESIISEKMKELYQKAKQIIQDQVAYVESIAENLVEKSTLSKDELLSLYSSLGKKKEA